GSVLQRQGAAPTPLGGQPVAIVRLGGDAITVNGSSHYVNGSFTVAAPVGGDPQGTADRITRTDGKAWDVADSFAVGQQVTVTGEWRFPGVTFARNATGDTITRAGGNWH